MQADLLGLKPSQITPARGWIFGEAILGEYETPSGILVVKDLKRNPKVEKVKVLSLGGPFTIHGRIKNCIICETNIGGVCERKSRPGRYWAQPGDTVWMKRGTAKKLSLGDEKADVWKGKTYCFVRNEDIVARFTAPIHMPGPEDADIPAQLDAPRDLVIVEPVYTGVFEDSKLFVMHDRDKEYIGQFHGIVAAAGPDYPYGLKVGDKIRFRRHEGVKIEIGDKKYLALKAKWIEAKETS